MTRLAIIAAVIAAVLIGLVIALRIPATQQVLEDLPGVGGAFESLADLIGGHSQGPIELVYRFERPPSREVLDAVNRLVLPAKAEMRGDKLVVTAADLSEAMHVGDMLDHELRSIRLFVVVYQSEELDRIKAQLRKDEQAKALKISVELDTIGYHLHAPEDFMMVNPAWAERHHCDGHHYEGTGTDCFVKARERIDAYTRGDPDLFVDAHPDAFALPAGRAFYVTDLGDAYELEAKPIEIQGAQIAGAVAAGKTLALALTPPAAAAVLARANAPTVELVAELFPGSLHPATVAQNGLALTIDGEGSMADDLLIASAGLRALR